MKLKQPFALALDFALQPENSPVSAEGNTAEGQWALVAIKHSSLEHPETGTAPHRSRFTLPAVPRPLTPKDREYFRALRQAEIRAWLAADRSTPESQDELMS